MIHMTYHAVAFQCDHCTFTGTREEVEVHDCAIQDSIDASGTGRCEDYPCCGHTDGLGCQTTPEMTSDFYHRNPHLLHEPGSPEWYDALADDYDEDDYDEGDAVDDEGGLSESRYAWISDEV